MTWKKYVAAASPALLFLLMAASPGLAETACGKLASVQKDVRTRPAAETDWRDSVLNEELFARDRVRTGAASRAAILYSDQTLHRINERSEVEVLPPDAGDPGAIRVLSGQHYFSTRRPKDFGRVETPTVTAAIRGTEFVVDVAADGTTTVTMIEGVVDATNEYGSLRVTAGEAAFVEPGKAPVRRIAVRPRDAVSWSLYYPSVVGGADAERLKSMGSTGQDLGQAIDSLAAGQVDQATPAIDRVRQGDPGNPIALALASIIELVADRKDRALSLANQAWQSDDRSPSAALALSFARQAHFDISGARDMARTAAGLDDGSAEALARLAELSMAEGDTRGARAAAEKAVRRNPDSVRGQTALGFVELAEFNTERAVAVFRRAVAIDAGFPLARLGLGIAMMRLDLTAGREEIQTAVLLDPENSLLRSYLAKAYYEERRGYEALKELDAAKRMDPSDPTPHLYESLIKRTHNLPVEALESLQRSIDLNDRRAVYRSRLLLDEDLAVRGADLAGVYNDLGFDRLGLVTARTSADIDQSNHSSHLFLAGTYRNLSGFAPAFLSEVLQARMFQPINTNAVRPDVINETVSFNEYTALFERPRVRGFANFTVGHTDNDLCSEAICDTIEVDRGSSLATDLTLTFNRDRFAGGVSFSGTDSTGFRENNDVDNQTKRAFMTWAPTSRDQFQMNVIDGMRLTGDLPLRDFPSLIGGGGNGERFDTHLRNIGLGYRRKMSPASDLVVSAIYSEADQAVSVTFPLPAPNPPFVMSGDGEFKGQQVEAQYVLRQNFMTWTAGAGRFDGEQTVSSDNGFTTSTATGDDEFSNAYVYARIRDLGRVGLTVGLAWEDVVAPVGLLAPRDSRIGAADLPYEESEISPKIGLSVRATPRTVFRATAYSRLTPAIGRLQTLEPTQVSGFNQFFNDQAGTSSRNYGVGVDHEFRRNLFAGMSVLQRELDIPEPFCISASTFVGCAGQTAGRIVERESEDWLANLYVNATLIDRLALSLDYSYERREFDFTQVNAVGMFQDFSRTERLRPQVRYFMPNGFFAGVRGTRFDQSIDEFPYQDLNTGRRTERTADFWTADLDIGYRLPRRWGAVKLTVLNLTDREFDFFRSALEMDVVPARTALLTLSFTSP